MDEQREKDLAAVGRLLDLRRHRVIERWRVEYEEPGFWFAEVVAGHTSHTCPGDTLAEVVDGAIQRAGLAAGEGGD